MPSESALTMRARRRQRRRAERGCVADGVSRSGGPQQLEHAESEKATGTERREDDQRLFAEHGLFYGRPPGHVQTFCYHECVFIKG
jgi:hypothetical protein